MKWVGLTGGIASGKSTVAQILREMGISVIDADQLAHRALQKEAPAFQQVLGLFGEEILNKDGEIDRKSLGRIVFSHPEKLRQLESVLHPLIQEESQKCRMKLEEQGEELAFYEVPLLFEKKLQERFDAVFLVFCPPEQQRKRLKERNSYSESEVEDRMAAQLPIEDKVGMSDFIIENTGSLADLKKQVVAAIKALSES